MDSFMNDLFVPFAWVVAFMVVFYAVNERFYFDIIGVGRRRAKRQFPVVAKKLGLNFVASSDRSEIGRIEGNYQGRKIRIAPDENATMLYRISGLPDIFLSTKVYERENIDTGNMVFDSFFRTRNIKRPDSIVDRINKRGAALEFLHDFNRRWKRKLEYFEVSDEGIRLSFKHGMNGYMPATDLEQLLPELSKFAGILEDILVKN
jgi:hypothetical protein